MRIRELPTPLRALLLVLGVVGATASQAADVRPMAKLGVDFGGETLTTVVFTNGTTQSVKSNQGIFIGGGMAILNEARDIEAELSLTYKFALIAANNGDLVWSRVPLDALVFYRMPKFRFGGGATYHFNPKVSGSGAASNINLKFDDALGFILQADWLIMDKKSLSMALGVRYTNIEYQRQNSSTSTTSNGVGITYSVTF